MLPAFERPMRTPAAVAPVEFTACKSAGVRVSLQHLYAVVEAVAHDDAPLAVNCNAVGTVELPISTTLSATKGSNVAAVAVSQNLHPMITEVGYNDVAGSVKRDAEGNVELPCA